MPFSIGPKTILSLIAGAALIGVAIWIYVTIVHLRSDNAALTSANAQLTADLSQANSDNQADLKALADLKAAYAQQESALQKAQLDLTAATTQTQSIVTETINAPAADKVCFPRALSTALDKLFPVASADSADKDSGGESASGPGLLQPVSSLAGPSRTAVTIGPPR